MLRPPLGVSIRVVLRMPPVRSAPWSGPAATPRWSAHRLVPSADGLIAAANAPATAARPLPRDRRPSLRDYRHPDTKKPGPQARRISGHRDAASRSPADYLTIKTPFIPTAKCAGKEQT